MRLQYYIEDEHEVEQDAAQLLEFAMFFDESNDISEGIGDVVKNIKGKSEELLKKIGLHGKQGKGVFEYLWRFNKGLAKMLYHAMKYSTGSPAEKEVSKAKIKEIAKSVKKEDVLDFLYKLDMLSLHVVSGPIHIIDAITGWHLGANIKDKVKPALEKAKKAIEWLESTKEELSGKLKVQLQKYVNAIRRVFNFGDFKKVTV